LLHKQTPSPAGTYSAVTFLPTVQNLPTGQKISAHDVQRNQTTYSGPLYCFLQQSYHSEVSYNKTGRLAIEALPDTLLTGYLSRKTFIRVGTHRKAHRQAQSHVDDYVDTTVQNISHIHMFASLADGATFSHFWETECST
jgi:hypothetical protein